MRIERLGLHIADTLGAILRGAPLAEAKAAIALGSRLTSWCASARLTEADDIHLTSCTTPGSVIVPAAFYLASRGAFATWGEFVAAALAGYETLIRVGYAIDGPRILARKVWPTLFAAAAGVAVVASRAWKLDLAQTAGALGTALAASTGIAPPAMASHSSRCIALGFAAEYGVFAALAARQGALGDAQLLERHARIAGVRISRRRLLRSARFFFDEIGLKPYPVARQALAAVEACRDLAGKNTRGITAITVSVPSAQARVINHPSWPANRMQSIAGVQYQIALALLHPERLNDCARTPPFATPALRSLAAKVRVRSDARLEPRYPEAWPARVVVERSGRRQSALVGAPRGDARNPMQWEEVRAKAGAAGAVLAVIRATGLQDPIPRKLLDALP
ncbi:MAG TPA: MmgE/PrpD family protein [Bryobacteraceae bacterium]|nr:MmgE/PrpD family protein [Bryobacteraceae bacterium]